jgi:hypothetical protein
MRTVSSAMRAAYLAAQTNEVVLTFLTVTYGGSSHYFVNNMASVVKDGQTYSPFAFAVTLPPDKDGNIGDATLTIDAVDRSIITAIRNATNRIIVNIVVALASDPDTDEVDLGTFEWKDISYNKVQVSGTLAYADVLDVLIPNLTITPTLVPGSF